jgi:hypothetical protein
VASDFSLNASVLYYIYPIQAQNTSGSSSPLCLRILKEGSRVRQKHNCLGIVFIAAIATICFGRAWPSSGHNVDVVHKWEKKTHNCTSGWFAAAVWVEEVWCGWGSSVEGFCGLRMCRILSGVDEEVFGRHYCRLASEDGQAWPKHVVAIVAINTIPRKLCFWRTLLPSFNTKRYFVGGCTFRSILNILRLGVRMWLKWAAQTCKFKALKED